MASIPDDVKSEPASIRFLWYLLRQEGQTTQRELRRLSGYDRDVVADALRQLERAGYAVDEGRPPNDLRTRRWRFQGDE